MSAALIGKVKRMAFGQESFDEFWTKKTPQWSKSPTNFVENILGVSQEVTRLDSNSLHEEKGWNKKTTVRFVCTSDTHNQTEKYNFHIPPGDVLIHAGDFSQVGDITEIYHFADWLDSLPHPIKIVIPGNHELTFDPVCMRGNRGSDEREKMVERLSQSCTLLEDTTAIVHGIKIFGSPWQPEFGGWAYNLIRGDECQAKWLEIPTDTDFLITHGPPAGHGDLCRSKIRAGCVELLQEIQTRIKPQYHIFGHIHEDPGVTTDGQTKFINASMCDIRYHATQYPILIDMPKVSEGMVLKSCPAEWRPEIDPRGRNSRFQ